MGANVKIPFGELFKTIYKKKLFFSSNIVLEFCNRYKFSCCPVEEETLLSFIAFLFKKGLQGSSIRCYLSAVRSLHIFNKYEFPHHSPRIEAALKGALTLSKPINCKEPITFDILQKIVEVCKARPDALMLIAAMTTAFFGCLRAGEICVQNGTNFKKKVNVCLKDLKFHFDKKYFTLLLKRSKTDTFNRGITITVGCSGHSICAYCAMNDLVNDKTNLDGNQPLFIYKESYLTKSYFISTTKMLVASIGLDSNLYAGHSYRSGCTTSAALSGFNSWEIKLLGRWQSEVYNIYIRKPNMVSSFARRLTVK